MVARSLLELAIAHAAEFEVEVRSTQYMPQPARLPPPGSGPDTVVFRFEAGSKHNYNFVVGALGFVFKYHTTNRGFGTDDFTCAVGWTDVVRVTITATPDSPTGDWARTRIAECIDRKFEFRIVVDTDQLADSGLAGAVPLPRGTHIVFQFTPETFDRNVFVLTDETLAAYMAFSNTFVGVVRVTIPWSAVLEVYTRHTRHTRES